MSVEKLLSEHGLEPDEAISWARQRAAELLANVEDPVLNGLMSGGDVDAPAASAAATPAGSLAAPSAVDSAEDDVDDDVEEMEELDVEELEELDVDDLDLVEDDGEGGLEGASVDVDAGDVDTGAMGDDGSADADTESDPGGHDFLSAVPEAGSAGGLAETSGDGELVYAPTDTQPLEAVDAEILEDSGSFAVDDVLQDEGDALVRTGDTQTQMDTASVLDPNADTDDERRDTASAPEPVEDDDSGDLFGDDELDIDIEV